MKKKFNILLLTALTLAVSFSGCKDEDGNSRSVNLFSLQDDIDFGAQVAGEIESDQASFPILDSSMYPEAYEHLRRITDTILNSGKVRYKEEFVWQTKIVHDDSTLNAFCTPGGYIYMSTLV
jgi:beta-barrel assembly-enhancing protease